VSWPGASFETPRFARPSGRGRGWRAMPPRALRLWMEPVWLRLGGWPRHRSGRSVLGFLARGLFAAKTPAHECWISLDFLGFSRQNRDFSMGYAAFSAENFFSRFFPVVRSSTIYACGLGHAEAQDCSWGERNLASDFLQEIVIRAMPLAASIQTQLALGAESCSGLDAPERYAPALARRYPLKPRPANPRSIMAQVEGSGTGLYSTQSGFPSSTFCNRSSASVK
jgi:hypothetical protein